MVSISSQTLWKPRGIAPAIEKAVIKRVVS